MIQIFLNYLICKEWKVSVGGSRNIYTDYTNNLVHLNGLVILYIGITIVIISNYFVGLL